MQGGAHDLEHVGVKCPWYASAGIAVWVTGPEASTGGQLTNHKGHPAEQAAGL